MCNTCGVFLGDEFVLGMVYGMVYGTVPGGGLPLFWGMRLYRALRGYSCGSLGLTDQPPGGRIRQLVYDYTAFSAQQTALATEDHFVGTHTTVRTVSTREKFAVMQW